MPEEKITLYIATSVDGFIATEDGGVSWLGEYQDETFGGEDSDGYEEFIAGVDCLVMGSKTYEQILGFGEWPYGERPTFVVTQRDLPFASDSVELVDKDIEVLADELKQQYGHVWLVGGAQLAQHFLKLELVDELTLSLIPVLLGTGIPLFESIRGPHQLSLIESVTRDGGIVDLQYNVESVD